MKCYSATVDDGPALEVTTMRELPPLPRPQPAQAKLDPTLHALVAHYLEMPGLSLTASQARRLCGMADLDLAACEREGIAAADLDFVEINEAFGAVVARSQAELGLPDDRRSISPGGLA